MKYYDTKLIRKINLLEGVVDVQLKVENSYTFIPGEFCYVKVEGEMTRPYSIIEVKDGILSLLIDCRNPGKGSDFFANLKENDSVFLSESVGKFRCNFASEKQKVFIATTTGIAPFVPMIKNFNRGTVQLVFGYREEGFENLIDYYLPVENLEVTYCQSKPSKTKDRLEGRVTHYIQIQENGYFQDKEFYVCGRNDMVKDVIAVLKEKNATDIFFENYG